MWFLWFWLVSIILTYIVNKIVSLATMSRLKGAGYRFRKCEQSVAEHLQTFLICCIPVYNIFLILIMLLMPSDKLDEVVLKKLKEKNLVKDPEEW